MFAFVRILIALCAVLASLPAAEREIKRRFAVQPGCTLKVDTHRGRVVVEESETAEVALLLDMDAGVKEAEAQRVFDAVQLEMSETGNAVSIRVRNPAERTLWIWEENKQVELSFKLTVPRQCSLDLTVGDGSVAVGNVAGRHRTQVRTGSVFFRRIDGSVDVRVESGTIIVSRCSGALTARATVGTIRTGTIGGPAQLHTGDGDLEVLAARAGAVLDAVAGNIVVGLPQGASGDVRAKADGGSVVARVEPDANCRIEASSSWGRVESKLPLTIESGEVGKRRLIARMGAGGPTLALRASGGNVRLEPLEFDVELTELAEKPKGE
ncbi:MAG: hypothetical protein HZA93_18460 [Verrucomicrobia bacterium]|nr:hypothetical protein [Verrucomicrobiota bacterium]